MTRLAELIGPDDLAESLADPRLRVFDATTRLRTEPGSAAYVVESGRPDYLRSHIPGAAFADVPGELSDPDGQFICTAPTAEYFGSAIGELGVANDTHVIVYAQEGATPWATRLWWLLRYFGHDLVSVLDGGLPAWEASGWPTQSGEHRYRPEAFVASVNPELSVGIGDVSANLDEPRFQLVNALSEQSFRGEGPSPYSRPGRIPGSVSVPWTRLVDPATHRFAAPDRIRSVFAAAGVSSASPAVCYCGGGVSATVDMFALHLTGRDDVRLYDGSLREWSARPELPMEAG